MKKDTITLTKEDFSFICPLKTEDMKAVDGGYFCQKCEKKVHDVTHMSQEDFQTLKQKSENLCVTIHKVAAVSLVLGLSACTSKPLTGKIVSTPSTNNRLAPFTVVDKNKTIIIDHVAEPQIAGDPVPEILGYVGESTPIEEEKR